MSFKRRTIRRNTKEFKTVLENAVECRYTSDNENNIPVVVAKEIIERRLSQDDETKLEEIEPKVYKVILDRRKYYVFKNSV